MSKESNSETPPTLPIFPLHKHVTHIFTINYVNMIHSVNIEMERMGVIVDFLPSPSIF